MTTICLQAGHQNISGNCSPDMRSGTGAPGEASWTPTIRAAVARILAAHGFTVVQVDANANCASTHPKYDLTLAIHYQANTGHSGFGVFVPDPSVDLSIVRSVTLAKSIRALYAQRTKLPDYSSPRLNHPGETRTATWENPNTLFYYLWNTQNGPLALIECGEGALGAPDHYLLYNTPAIVAAAIAEGICAAFGVPYRALTPTPSPITPQPVPPVVVPLPEPPPVIPPDVPIPPPHPDIPSAPPIIKPVALPSIWSQLLDLWRQLFG